MAKIKKYKKNNLTGITIIEALVVLFIFALITVAFYSVFSLGMNYIAESKNRLGAIALVSEKMEIIRNLKYDDIGIQGGIPSGNILADEDVVENGKSYHVKSFAQYIDDSFDGNYPGDLVPNDYKRIKVTVSWAGARGGGEVSSVSRFVPPGMEVAAGDGILSINVIDSQGQPVAQSDVSIINGDVSPAVNISSKTDDDGNLIFPGASASIQKYQVGVSKSGYESVSTVDPTTIIDYSPIDTNASVIAGAVNMKTIVQDKISNLEILSVDADDAAIPNVSFDIQGGRNLGPRIVLPNDPYYNLQETNRQTDGSGKKDYNSLSPGQYEFSNSGSISGYTLIGISDISGFESGPPVKYIYSLPAGEDKTVKIKYADNNADSLLVKVVRADDGSLVSGASVKLIDGTGGSSTEMTLADGVAFFKAVAGTYTLEITAGGFNNYSESVDIDKLTNKQADLTAS